MKTLGTLAATWATCLACASAPSPSHPPATPTGDAAKLGETPAAATESDQARSLPTLQGTQAPRSKICADAEAEYKSPPVLERKAQLVKDGFVFVEGPVWSDQFGALLFSEMDFGQDGSNGPPSTIHLLTQSGDLFTFLGASGSNGLAIDERGLLAATHDDQALSRIDLDTKQRRSLVGSIDGKKFNSPNDLTISSDGHIYFTDPDWQLGTRPNQTGATGVYWVTPDNEVRLVDATLDKPNGVALSPDEKTLYVGSVDGTVWSYTLESSKPGARREFAKVDGPDGMAIDCAGNLYVASHGAGTVEVLDSNGGKQATIAVAPKTTNAAFGGPDRKTLFVTAGNGVYSLPSQVPGYPY